MSDIVERLLLKDGMMFPDPYLFKDAKAEIERLRVINDELVDALEVTRMQLRVSAAGKIALSPEKHLALIEGVIAKAKP